jgi:hypothetical protein
MKCCEYNPQYREKITEEKVFVKGFENISAKLFFFISGKLWISSREVEPAKN